VELLSRELEGVKSRHVPMLKDVEPPPGFATDRKGGWKALTSPGRRI